MRVISHLKKHRELDALLDRLDPVQDQELWIWTAMTSCTNLLNAALHHCGATEETDSFHTQVNGLYMVPNRHENTLADAMHAPGDVMHFGQPSLPGPLPPEIERAAAALKTLEDLREPHVRGDIPVSEDAAAQWRASYASCKRNLSTVLGIAP